MPGVTVAAAGFTAAAAGFAAFPPCPMGSAGVWASVTAVKRPTMTPAGTTLRILTIMKSPEYLADLTRSALRISRTSQGPRYVSRGPHKVRATYLADLTTSALRTALVARA